MAFRVDFNWASQAIIETVAIAFPSLEAPNGTVVNDPPIPQLQWQQSSPNVVTLLGNGRWNRDTSYRFNAGCNPDTNTSPTPGDSGVVTVAEGNQLEQWFLARYNGSNPGVLKNGEKWNLHLTRNGALYNFHVLVRDPQN
jgi:hypothetical protein